MPVRDLGSFTAPRHHEVAVMCNRGANGIDGTIATALGQAQAWGRGPAALVVGDLAFLHDAGGLLASAQMDASLLVVVINNGGGGIFGFLPIAQHPERFEQLFLTPQRARIEPLCQAAGAGYERVETLEALERAARQNLGRPGVFVIEALVDREHNLAQHRLAWAQVSRACRAALGLSKEVEHG
jgi:2-succinyl-5-enolpyruvyl-6-hydroxy-3-cyclohexene-1-carboxylate synthase